MFAYTAFHQYEINTPIIKKILFQRNLSQSDSVHKPNDENQSSQE